jgi:protein subunit release factor B
VEQERDANPLIRLLNERRCRATVDQRLAHEAQRQRQERADQARRSQRETERCRQRAGAIALELPPG